MPNGNVSQFAYRTARTVNIDLLVYVQRRFVAIELGNHTLFASTNQADLILVGAVVESVAEIYNLALVIVIRFSIFIFVIETISFMLRVGIRFSVRLRP